VLKVFVYGTLKPGECNYLRYCAGIVVEEKCAIAQGLLFSLPFGYPAMTPGNSLVKGFVLSFSTYEILHQLDWLEDYDPQRPTTQNEYYRQLIDIYDTAKQPLGTAWAYLMTLEQVKAYQGILLPNGWWSG
jgi:gamma-glutamylcyclotransferase (GGCT)/AIG2-like uncharacterized protein YtfP